MLNESLIFSFKKLFCIFSEQHVLPIHKDNSLRIGYLWYMKKRFFCGNCIRLEKFLGIYNIRFSQNIFPTLLSILKVCNTWITITAIRIKIWNIQTHRKVYSEAQYITEQASSKKVFVNIYFFCRLFFKDWQYRKWLKLENCECKHSVSLQPLRKFLNLRNLNRFFVLLKRLYRK